MSRLSLMCVVVLLACGCKSEEQSVEPANVVEVLPSDPAADVANPDAPNAPVDREPPTAAAPADPAIPATPVEATPSAQTAPRPRDLAAELRAAVGSPADCLRDYRPSTAMTIRISISAIVRPTGMIIEPNASGRGLSANDRRCVEQRIGDVMLSPLGGESSEPVSTDVEIRYQPPVVEEADVGAPDPKLEGVVESLPKKKPIAPSGTPIEGGHADPIEGPDGVPIEGPEGVPIEGPQPKPIEGY